MANRTITKINDGNFHIWSPSCFWGDQMFNLMAAKQLSKGAQVVIHSWKDAWDGHTGSWLPMNHDILKFWSMIKFVNGIIFDIDQHKPIERGIKESNYDVQMTLNSATSQDFIYDIKKDINFSSFPVWSTSEPWPFLSEHKVAAFQPISILHRKKEDVISEYVNPWNQCIEALLDKEYKILAIGSDKDKVDVEKYYPSLLKKYPITNLMGKMSIFDSINLVMNYASFVLSCDSWSAWYGISSRTKTAVSAGKTYRDGQDLAYIRALGNNDIYKLDYAHNKHDCDTNLSNWIKENA